MGRIVIDTDVVRGERTDVPSQTHENAKDSTKMAVGGQFVCCWLLGSGDMSPNQTANGLDRSQKTNRSTRSKWQDLRYGIWRDFGNEVVSRRCWKGMTTDEIYAWWRSYLRAKQI